MFWHLLSTYIFITASQNKKYESQGDSYSGAGASEVVLYKSSHFTCFFNKCYVMVLFLVMLFFKRVLKNMYDCQAKIVV